MKSCFRFVVPAILLLAGCLSVSAQVSVTATAGTMGPTSYTTLKGAFDAVNAGTHQGAISISLTGNTTETATAALNASGGTASYTGVSVSATTQVTVSGNIAGAIIRLNGADNVTVDGRIVGAGRNIKVQNTSALAATAAVWLSSNGAGAGATNNTIRNLELLCGVAQNANNLATFGIIMSGTAISTTSDGQDNDNNSFIDNKITRVRYGIMTRGATANNNQGVTVTDNAIGPDAFGADQIGKVGIFMQADAGSTVSRNTVKFVGGDFANTANSGDRVGIAIGVESWSGAPSALTSSGYTVTKNIIHDVVEERTTSAVGLLLGTTNSGGATNNLVANNFIYNVKSNGTSGDQTVGIGISGGNGDRVVFNAVRSSGDLDPNASATAASHTPAGLRVANAPANLNIRNNSFYWDLSSSSATTLNGAVIQLPSATFAFGTGGLNNNNYYFPPANTTMRTGAIGSTSTATTFHATLANWQAALTPAQDAASLGADPQYLSATDLHIASGSPNLNAGTTVSGVSDDIDGETRPNGANPEIGADELQAAGAGALNFSAAAVSGNEGTTYLLTVNRAGGLTGTVTVDVTQTAGTATSGLVCGSGADFVNINSPQTLTFGDLVASQTVPVQLCSDMVSDPGETVGFTLGNATGGATIGATNAATLTITDVPPPTLQFSAAAYSGPETAPSSVTLAVNRVNDSSPVVSVDYTLTDGSAVGGAACGPGVDYVNTGGTLNYGAGVTSQNIVVPVCDDAVGDISETFVVKLMGQSVNALLGTPSMATATIDDNDPPPGDTCADAPALTLGIPTIGTLANAANDFTLSAPGASTCFLGFGQNPSAASGRDRVYSFTPAANGSYDIRAKFSGTGGDPVVYLTDTCPSSATTFECANSGGVSPVATNAANRNNTTVMAQESLGCVSMTGGATYYVVVDEAAAGATGLGTYQLEMVSCPTQEIEFNGDPSVATPAVGGYMQAVLDGAGTDVDFFSLGAPAAGSRLFMMTDTQGSHPSGKDTELRAVTADDTLEYDDNDGDTPWGGSSSLIVGLPLPGGNVYARVNSNGGLNYVDPYNFIYSVRPPGTQSAEAEPNDTIAQANSSSQVGYYEGTISGASDVDFFKLTLNPGEMLFVGLDSNPTRDNTCFLPSLTLFDKDGKTVVTTNGSNSATGSGAPITGTLLGSSTTSCGAALAYRIPETNRINSPQAPQTYHVSVQGNDAGDYLIVAGRAGGPTVPTASGVSVSGKIARHDGRGIRDADVSLSNLLTGETLTTQTDKRGEFIFSENVPPGATYLLSVSANGYIFNQPSRIISVSSDLEGLVFQARKRQIITP